MKAIREGWGLLRQAGEDWLDDKASQLGASLAFYSLLSLAPLLVIAVAIAALAFDEKAVTGELKSQFTSIMGRDAAEAIGDMLTHAQKPAVGSIAAVLGIATLLFGATGVFGQLQDAMNTIWEVPPQARSGIWSFLRSRFLSLAMVLGTGFLLLVSLLISAMIAGAGKYFSSLMPGWEVVGHSANLAVSFVVVTLLFAMIFKFLPDAQIAWRDVWVGALLTAVLFIAGKFAIGLYLGKSSLSSSYGAAGSLVVLLVWIYYSAQILFFGAELTQAYARRYGSKIVPTAAGDARMPEKASASVVRRGLPAAG